MRSSIAALFVAAVAAVAAAAILVACSVLPLARLPGQGEGVELCGRVRAAGDMAVFWNPPGGASDAQGTLLVSGDDAGRSWRNEPDRCGAVNGTEYDMRALAAAPDAVCNDRAGGGPFISVSTDAGETFGSTPLLVGENLFDQLATTSASDLFVGNRRRGGEATPNC